MIFLKQILKDKALFSIFCIFVITLTGTILYASYAKLGLCYDGSYILLRLLDNFNNDSLNIITNTDQRARFFTNFLNQLIPVITYVTLGIKNKHLLAQIFSLSLYLVPTLLLVANIIFAARIKKPDIAAWTLLIYVIAIIPSLAYGVVEVYTATGLNMLLLQYLICNVKYNKLDIAVILTLCVFVFNSHESIVLRGLLIFLAGVFYVKKSTNSDNTNNKTAITGFVVGIIIAGLLFWKQLYWYSYITLILFGMFFLSGKERIIKLTIIISSLMASLVILSYFFIPWGPALNENGGMGDFMATFENMHHIHHYQTAAIYLFIVFLGLAIRFSSNKKIKYLLWTLFALCLSKILQNTNIYTFTGYRFIATIFSTIAFFGIVYVDVYKRRVIPIIQKVLPIILIAGIFNSLSLFNIAKDFKEFTNKLSYMENNNIQFINDCPDLISEPFPKFIPLLEETPVISILNFDEENAKTIVLGYNENTYNKYPVYREGDRIYFNAFNKTSVELKTEFWNLIKPEILKNIPDEEISEEF